jgi:hypothetical protein
MGNYFVDKDTISGRRNVACFIRGDGSTNPYA